MMKGLIMDDNLSNLTSASGEISASSGSKIESSGALYPQQSSTSANQAPAQKKKRNLPGNPDPDAEVIALTPKTLLATNRFICEICNKGFQRDQNLQLHKRGHNLPWKLKQRSNQEVVKKKVYVCPEVDCVHHDPSRALGDLTGIKKHFCRKHGEKKWKCEKCSKRYAVQSDWKAHSKICGTREYRCDCGTLFSRRDSFITHRAFCDALAEESGRANPFPISSQLPASSASHMINLPGLSTVKRERGHHQELNNSVFNPIPRPENTPPWLAFQEAGPGTPQMNNLSSQLYPTSLGQSFLPHENPSLNPSCRPLAMTFHSPAASPHMSATALLQKAAQMGVTMSKPSPILPAEAASPMLRPRQAHDMSENTVGFIGSSTTAFSTCTAGSGHDLGSSSHEAMGSGLGHGSVSFGNKAAVTSATTVMECIATSIAAPSSVHNTMNSSFSSSVNATGFEAWSSLDGNFQETLSSSAGSQLRRSDQEGRAAAAAGGRRGGGNDGLTRDFLGLKSFSRNDFLNMTGIDHINSSSIYRQQDQNQAPWHG